MEMLSALKSGVIDIAISIESTPDMFNGCEKFIYAQESMCFAARRDLMQRVADTRDEEMIFRVVEQVPVLHPRLDCFPGMTRRRCSRISIICLCTAWSRSTIWLLSRPWCPPASRRPLSMRVIPWRWISPSCCCPMKACQRSIREFSGWRTDSNPLVEQFYACIRDVESGPPIMPPEY